MIEYEYLKYNSNDKFISYKDYRNKKNEYLQEINPVEEEKEKEISTTSKQKKIEKTDKKLMFVFGTNPLNINNIRKKLIDFTKKSGYQYNEIIPDLSLFHYQKVNKNDIISFYVDNLNKIESNPKLINFIFIYFSCNVLTFLNEINKKIVKFTSNFDLLNISYTVNYSWFKSDRFKNKITHNYIYDDLINNIFIDEGLLPPDKITKLNKLISLANPKANIYTTRSFYLNDKELKQMFETIMLRPKVIKFYLDYYESISLNKSIYQNIYIPFKYMVKEDLLKKFFVNSINMPLFFQWKKIEIENDKKIVKIVFPPDEQPKPKLSDDAEYQKYLEKIVSQAKVAESEPYFVELFGNCILNTEENRKNSGEQNKRNISKFECNYKIKNLTNIKNEEKNEIGIFVLGKNVVLEKNDDFYEKILLTLSGEFPDLRPYKKKEELTQEERQNLNFINLTRPLPPGWSLEGPVVVDENDEIHYEHPYLEQFIDEYIELNNKAIDQYNNNIQKQIEELLI
jgi:hypothetical protein